MLDAFLAPVPEKIYSKGRHFTQHTNDFNMNDVLKNPVVVFLAGLLLLWLVFKLLKVMISVFWVFILAFIILFFVNDRFRRAVRMFLGSIFRR